jgi:hypothetical protein
MMPPVWSSYPCEDTISFSERYGVEVRVRAWISNKKIIMTSLLDPTVSPAVIIHGRDGRIQSSDSYGNDASPPRDREH